MKAEVMHIYRCVGLFLSRMKGSPIIISVEWTKPLLIKLSLYHIV